MGFPQAVRSAQHRTSAVRPGPILKTMSSKSKESNTQLLLGKVLDERRQTLDPNAQPGSFFEYVVASELLKTYDLSIDEIREGIVGGGWTAV